MGVDLHRNHTCIMVVHELIATRHGIALKNAHLETISRIRRELTVVPEVSPGMPPLPSYSLYTQTGPSSFLVPHYWAIASFPEAKVRDERCAGQPIDVTFNGTLKESMNQPQAVAATLESLHNHGGSVLSLRTGGGKTVCALSIISTLKVKTLIIVNKVMLAAQWKQRIHQFTNARVSTIQGATCDTSGDIVIALIQTLISRPWNNTSFDAFGFLVYDECHCVAAKAFGSTMKMLSFPYVLGLSATPRRRDGLERTIFYHLGPLAYSMQEPKRRDVIVRALTYKCDAYNRPAPMNRIGGLDHAGLLGHLADNIDRTNFIADLALCDEFLGRDILILSHRRAHCEDICAVLNKKGADASTYLGGAKAVPTSRILVATYALVGEGFDESRLTALIFATPCSDITQPIGRVMRGDSSVAPLVYDIVDAWGSCYAQSSKRKKQYVAAGYTVYSSHDGTLPPSRPAPHTAAKRNFMFVEDA